MKHNTSVAIATYNGERYIIEQLTSILDQSYPIDEVIICDDRSTDDTVKIVRDFITRHQLNAWRIVVNKKNLGFPNNFWKAINLCSGDIIFLSDQDDAWYQSKVSEMMHVLQDKTINMVVSSYDICDAEGKIGNSSVKQHRNSNDGNIEDIRFEDLIIDTRIRGCSMCFRRNIIVNEKLSYNLGHDWLLTCYASLKGRAVYLNKILFKYRVHDANVSSVRQHKQKESPGIIAAKRAERLTNEVNAFLLLSTHKLVNQRRKKLLGDRAIFSYQRASLYRNFEITACLRLTLGLGTYTRLSRHGILGGVLIYLEDIKYSVQAKLSRKS